MLWRFWIDAGVLDMTFGVFFLDFYDQFMASSAVLWGLVSRIFIELIRAYVARLHF